MNPKDRPRSKLDPGDVSSSKEVDDLRSKLQDMQLEIAILKETINVLKKDPGVDKTALKNREKAVIAGALKNKYLLPILLKKLELSKSSYYYQEASFRKNDKYHDLRLKIARLFQNSKERYGYIGEPTEC